MSNCARCNGELLRSRVHVDGKEYHLECPRTEADWRGIDRLAEVAMQGLCADSDKDSDLQTAPGIAEFSVVYQFWL